MVREHAPGLEETAKRIYISVDMEGSAGTFCFTYGEMAVAYRMAAVVQVLVADGRVRCYSKNHGRCTSTQPPTGRYSPAPMAYLPANRVSLPTEVGPHPAVIRRGENRPTSSVPPDLTYMTRPTSAATRTG